MKPAPVAETIFYKKSPAKNNGAKQTDEKNSLLYAKLEC